MPRDVTRLGIPRVARAGPARRSRPEPADQPEPSTETMTIMAMRHLVLTGGFLGLSVIALAILARGEDPSIPHSERTTLTGAHAAAHEEVERRETIVPAGTRRDDRLVRAYLAVVEQ